MKHLFFILLAVTAVAGCKKSTSSGAQAGAYLTVSANSTWNYQQTNSSTSVPVVTNYTITSTNKDTSINGRTYHIFANSAGGQQYLGVSGHDYYQFDSLPFPNAQLIERLYLKDNVAINTNWVQNINLTVPGVSLPIPLVLTNTITEKGISRTVNNIAYSNVIHVQTSISSSVVPAASLVTDINSYYAEKYGLIENTTVIQLNFAGVNQTVNLKTILISASLK